MMLSARQTFWVGDRKIMRGQLVAESDPVVKGRESLFDVPGRVTELVVEQATAAPGERRTTPKRTTKKG